MNERIVIWISRAIAGSARYFFNKRKGDLSCFFILFFRHGVLMVIQLMRFIDNGRTVPQVLKASPPLSTLSSSPRSRGMHPIIGTLSVSPRGDNDALPPIHPPSLYPDRHSLLPALGSQSFAKNLIYPLCSALPGERRVEREEERGGIERRMRKGISILALSVSSSCRLCTPAFL